MPRWTSYLHIQLAFSHFQHCSLDEQISCAVSCSSWVVCTRSGGRHKCAVWVPAGVHRAHGGPAGAVGLAAPEQPLQLAAASSPHRRPHHLHARRCAPCQGRCNQDPCCATVAQAPRLFNLAEMLLPGRYAGCTKKGKQALCSLRRVWPATRKLRGGSACPM